ncbi:MAG: 50S ribosomal protein L20 [Candidatus Omnitrophota bacterium]
MARVKHSISTRQRKKKVMKAAKGQYGDRSRRYRMAKESVARGLVYATRDRRVKKREFRALWTVRINAACRELGTTYSKLITGLKKADVLIDRKIMAELAVNDAAAFAKLVEIAQA